MKKSFMISYLCVLTLCMLCCCASKEEKEEFVKDFLSTQGIFDA